MSTYTQIKFRRHGKPKIFTNRWTPNENRKSGPEKQEIYNGYGHRHTMQIQKIVEIQTVENLCTPKHDTKTE